MLAVWECVMSDVLRRVTPDVEGRRDIAVAALKRTFDAKTDVIGYAPGRINLIGEHVDYCDGLVMPFGVGYGCAVAVAKTDRGALRLHAADLGESAEVPLDDEPLAPGSHGLKVGSWASMVTGVLAGLLERGGYDALRSGIDLTLTSDVPIGGGLSSSAAVETATATALAALAGVELPVRDKALLCQHAEHTFVGMPCGVMDQYASAGAQAGHAMLLDCRTVEAQHAPMPNPEQALLIAFASGVSHSLAASAYPQRRASAEAATVSLGVKSLRDLTPDQIDPTLLSHEVEGDGISEQAAATHVVGEITRTAEAAEAMREGDFARLGHLMNESHISLRDVYKVSCEEVDAIQRVAAEQPGVFGARITGGGFGGFCIALVDPADAEAAAATVRAVYQTQTGIDCAPRAFTAEAGARVLA